MNIKSRQLIPTIGPLPLVILFAYFLAKYDTQMSSAIKTAVFLIIIVLSLVSLARSYKRYKMAENPEKSLMALVAVVALAIGVYYLFIFSLYLGFRNFGF